jgi:hypothetical protein
MDTKAPDPKSAMSPDVEKVVRLMKAWPPPQDKATIALPAMRFKVGLYQNQCERIAALLTRPGEPARSEAEVDKLLTELFDIAGFDLQIAR